MEYDCNVQTTSWCLQPVVPAIYRAHPIHSTCHQSGSLLQNRSTAGHFPRKVATAKAVWPYCPSRTGSRPCTRTASFHQSPRGLATPKRSSTPVLATNSRSWSRATQLWPPYSMSACGRSFRLVECRGNSHAPWRARHVDDDNDISWQRQVRV